MSDKTRETAKPWEQSMDDSLRQSLMGEK